MPLLRLGRCRLSANASIWASTHQTLSSLCSEAFAGNIYQGLLWPKGWYRESLSDPKNHNSLERPGIILKCSRETLALSTNSRIDLSTFPRGWGICRLFPFRPNHPLKVYNATLLPVGDGTRFVIDVGCSVAYRQGWWL